MLYNYLDHKPAIADDVYIAPTAAIIGDVEIGAGSTIWFNAVIRADNNPVRIGKNTSIQDNACVHDNTTIGSEVTVGHSAIVHGCSVADGVTVGMGAVILDKAVIGEDAVIAAGSLVKVGTIVPPRTLFAGNPAVFKKDLNEETVRHNREHARYYSSLGAEYGRR